MGAIERMLLSGETVVYRGLVHWVVLAQGASVAVVALALAVAGLSLGPGGARMGLLGVAALVLIAAAFQGIRGWVLRETTEIAITNRRIIVKTGLVARNSTEITLNRIESVVVNQSLLGRMLDYGDVVIRGVGAGLEPVTNVASPLEFRRHINPGD